MAGGCRWWAKWKQPAEKILYSRRLDTVTSRYERLMVEINCSTLEALLQQQQHMIDRIQQQIWWSLFVQWRKGGGLRQRVSNSSNRYGRQNLQQQYHSNFQAWFSLMFLLTSRYIYVQWQSSNSEFSLIYSSQQFCFGFGLIFAKKAEHKVQQLFHSSDARDIFTYYVPYWLVSHISGFKYL